MPPPTTTKKRRRNNNDNDNLRRTDGNPIGSGGGSSSSKSKSQTHTTAGGRVPSKGGGGGAASALGTTATTTTSRSKSNNNNTNTNRKRKRKKEKLQQYGIDLPEIPGVPIEVIPLLVNAIKIGTKFFQHHTQNVYNDDWQQQQQEDEDDGKKEDSGASNNILSTLLDRIEDSNNAAEGDVAAKTKQQQKERKIKMQDAIQSWLQSVKRFVFKRDSNPYQRQDQQQQHEDDDDATLKRKNRRLVPLSCFLYLLELGSQHKRIAVRRTALCMNRHLLAKSSDCRQYLLMGENNNHLWEWIQVLVTVTPSGGTDDNKVRLWQKEGHLLLLFLLEEGYDELYPKLITAEQYLSQSCGFIIASTNAGGGDDDQEEDLLGTTRNMTSLRELRDIALQYGREEIRRVTKLLAKCHKCMDILVPRLGVSEEETAAAANETKQQAAISSSNNNLLCDDDDDEDDNIEWEDADDDDNDDDNIDWEDGDNDKGQEEEEEDHAQAVERTLRAMESIGGIAFRGLGLEINLSKPEEQSTTTAAASNNNPDIVLARQRYAKYAQFLSERHLPRIEAWLEGLIKADRLTTTTQGQGGNGGGNNRSSAALILMSPSQGEEREILKHELKDLKVQVKSSIDSAIQLGLITTIVRQQQQQQTTTT